MAAEAGVKSGELQKRIDDLDNSFHLQKERADKPILWVLGNKKDPHEFLFHRFVLYGDGTTLFADMTRQAKLNEEQVKELLRWALQQTELIPPGEAGQFTNVSKFAAAGPESVLLIDLKEQGVLINFHFYPQAFSFSGGRYAGRREDFEFYLTPEARQKILTQISNVINTLEHFTYNPSIPYLPERMILSLKHAFYVWPSKEIAPELSPREPGISKLAESADRVKVEVIEENEKRGAEGNQWGGEWAVPNPRATFKGEAVRWIFSVLEKGKGGLKGCVKVGDQYYWATYALIPPGFDDSSVLIDKVGKAK